jgi:hypothetical protein
MIRGTSEAPEYCVMIGGILAGIAIIAWGFYMLMGG